VSASDPPLLLKPLLPAELRRSFASPTVITSSGSGTACISCAGRGYRVSQHPVPWVDSAGQGELLYRTKLCCLACAGLGFILDSAEPALSTAEPLVIAEPYIDVEFHSEE